jgi:hypothetical protein
MTDTATAATVWPSIIGTIVGGVLAIAGGAATQLLIDLRDQRERAERAVRVKALFASHVKAVLTLVHWQVESGIIRDMKQFEYRLAPLRAIREDAALLLNLEPSAIGSVTDALVTIDDSMRTAVELVAREERLRDAAPSPNAKAQSDERVREGLKSLFKEPDARLKAALTSLGHK